jgi:hypothetical protein
MARSRTRATRRRGREHVGVIAVCMGCMSFSARSLLVLVCSAMYTAPIPPALSGLTIRNSPPTIVPGFSCIGAVTPAC